MALEKLVRKARNFKNALVLTGTMALASTGLFGQNTPVIQPDTVWATGNVWVREESTNAPIPNANVNFKSVYIPGDTIPDTLSYTFITNSGGWVLDATVPEMIDIGVGRQELQDIVQTAAVFPNPTSTPVVAFRGKATDNYLNIYNVAGQLIDQVKTNYDPGRNISGANVDLQDKAPGIYLFSAKTDQGIVTGKINNNGIARRGSGFANVPEESLSQIKSIQNEDAIYDITITAEGYEVHTAQEIVTDGFMFAYFMQPGAGLPQHQDIGGIVHNESGNPIAGVTVKVLEQGTNDLLGEMITAGDGEYLFEDIPAGKDIYFQVGGHSDKFGFDGDEYEIPDLIQIEADTANLNFMYTLYNKTRTVPNSGGQTETPTAFQIDEMYIGPQTELGANRNLLWDQTVGWNDSQREANRTMMNNGMNLFGLEGRYVEVFDILNQSSMGGYNVYTNPLTGEIGIHLESGGDETFPYPITIITNLGNIINGILAADVTISGNANAFNKENFGRAINIDQVTSRDSYMNPLGNPANNLDRAIVNMIVNHYEKMISEDKAYFGLTNIVDNIPGMVFAPQKIFELESQKEIYNLIISSPTEYFKQEVEKFQ